MRFSRPSTGTILVAVALFVALYDDITCSDLVADVNPPTVGETGLPFDARLGIPAGSGLSEITNESVAAEVFTDGYAVPSNQVPTARAAGTRTPSPQTH